MKKLILSVLLLIPVTLFSQTVIHDQMSPLMVLPMADQYTVIPNYLQNATITDAADSNIGENQAMDLFVDFQFDTTDYAVYLVYTNDGTSPSKANGTVVNASFSTYDAGTGTRLWKAQIPGQPEGSVVNYVFYVNTSGGSLADANQRLSLAGYDGTWTEADSFFTVTLILPIKLNSFGITKNSFGNPELTWQSSSECGFSHFELERSISGSNHFEKIFEIPGKGFNISCLGYSYDFSDVDISKNSKISKALYRLKLVDESGKFEYSEIVGTNIQTKKFTFYNAASKQLRIENIDQPTKVEIVNSNGRIAVNQEIDADTVLDVQELPSGLHVVVLEQNGKRSVEKFMVQ